MQNIQSPLGNNIHPLGIRSSLSHPHKMLWRKESPYLHSRSNFISSIQTKPPLVTSSKFFLSRQYEASIQPLIGWDTQDINSEFPLLQLDSSDSIALPESSNIHSSELVENSIPEIMPTRIENNTSTSNDTLSEINIKGKSKSKKPNKSQPSLEKKLKPKSKTKKTVKSSAAKNVEQLANQSNIPINFNEHDLLASDEPLSVEFNSEVPILQLDIASDNAISNDDFISIKAPIGTTSTSRSIENESTLFNNIVKGELQANLESISSLTNAESPFIESILQLQPDNNVNELSETSLIKLPLLNNIEETETVTPSTIINNEQKIIPTSSQLVNISDIQLRATPPQQDIEIPQVPSIVENQITSFQPNLIQKEDVELSITSPSPEEKLPHPNKINSNFEAITAIEPDLISESITNDFVTDNLVADNFLENTPLLPTTISPDIDDTLSSLANDENTVGIHSYAPKVDVTAPNSESLVVKKPITVQPKIDSSITDESPNSAPVQLTPTSVDLEDISSLFTNSDNNEPLLTLESQSAIAVNVSNVSANVTSLEHDSNIENTTSESTESHPILALPEIGEAPLVSSTSPEIAEEPIFNNKLLGVHAPLTTTSPEIAEKPRITTTSFEIVEEPMSNDKPLDIYAPLTNTSPEIDEAPVVSAISPEIAEKPRITATSLEIVEEPISNDKPLSIYAPLTNTSPEIDEAPVVSAISTEISESTSIFRKIIDNEQTVESEFPFAVVNPEISTFVNTSDNPDTSEQVTSTQNEVSTPPKVEQNAPAPKDYATGGHVTDSRVESRQQIAPSDTVPAMLTPGEFVINIRDAQKNLPLLHHINTGGTPQDIILPSLQIPNPKEPEETTSPETPTKVDSFPDTSLQLKNTETHSPQISNSLISSSLGLNISKQKLSILNSPQLNSLQNETIDVDEPSPQYSSPPLIFRKANSSTNTSSQWSNTPSQWSSVEDLLNGNNDEFTSFNFSDMESNSQNYEFSHASESPQIFAKHLPTPRGFADGGEVTPADVSREIQPVTETIDVSSSSQKNDNDKDDTANLEALAREIYNRLRQRIEIERERHGGYSGRLPW